MPSAPAGEPWELSLAAYLRQTTDLPSLAIKPLGLLDRYGAVAVGPETAGFDGEDVPWDKVIRLEVRDVVDVVSDAAMAREAEKIRSLLPPVPGRKWVVDHAMALLGNFAAPLMSKTRGGDVVSEIVYRGKLGREKTLQAGVFAALVMATWPDVQRSLTATARLNGAQVYGERPLEEEAPELESPQADGPAELPGGSGGSEGQGLSVARVRDTAGKAANVTAQATANATANVTANVLRLARRGKSASNPDEAEAE